jgi:imidazolonepropionase-like amidohydrolase
MKYGFESNKRVLTTIPAALLGKATEMGTLKTGSLANFVITSGEILKKQCWLKLGSRNKYVVSDNERHSVENYRFNY